MNAKILIVDDDADIVMMLEDRLRASGYETVTANDGQEALEQIAHESPHLVLLDLTLPRISGLDVLKRLPSTKQFEGLPIIVMTAHGSIQAAVEAMKEGAYDFLTKPLDKDHLLIVIRKALERDSLRQQVAYLRSEVDGRYASIVGNSATVKSVVEAAQRAAKSDAGVLLLGESGTGKELFARSIHQWSHRCAMPLIVINCVALTETLLENELFGHERGAFTGADHAKPGLFEVANGGTIFLDEIGEVSPATQTKLLRVLDTSTFRHVGATREIRVDVRILTATNRDIPAMVRQGLFREDLYYRLSTITVEVPPLRARGDDIKMLAQHFAAVLNERFASNKEISEEALDLLQRHSWPGNVRELLHVVEAALVLCEGTQVLPEHLPLSLRNSKTAAQGGESKQESPLPTLQEAELTHVRMALAASKGHRGNAAKILGISERNLYRKLRDHGLA